MRQIQRIFCAFLALGLLIASLPISALAEEMQELQIMEVLQTAEDIVPPENAPLPVQQETEEPQEIQPASDAEGGPAELPAELEKQPVPEAPAAAEIPSPEEETAAEEPAVTEETAEIPLPETMPEPLEAEAQESLEPIELPAAEYAIGGDGEGAPAADLPIYLPETALPVAEIEGLVPDADYAQLEGVLYIKAAWLAAQQGDAITLTIHGADLNTYLQPVLLLVAGEAKMQPMLSGEYDVSNLFINGEPASNGSGEGWSYAPSGVLSVDVTNADITLSGSATLYYINVRDLYADDTQNSNYGLWFDSVNIHAEYNRSAVVLDSTGESKMGVHMNFKGSNSITSKDAFISGANRTILLGGDGILNVDTIGDVLIREVVVDGPVVYVTSIDENLTLNSGTVNVSGNDKYALKAITVVNGGELNIEKQGDGLEFHAIQYANRYTQNGGTVNICLSGESSFVGIGTNGNACAINGGELNIRIADAYSACGLNVHCFEMNGGTVNIEITDAVTSAKALYTNTYVKLNGGSLQASIRGGNTAYGFAGGAELYQKEADVDISIAGVNETAIGMVLSKMYIYSGNVNVSVDFDIKNGIAVAPEADYSHQPTYSFRDGYAKFVAENISTGEIEAKAPDGSLLPMQGSCLILDGGVLKIYPRKKIVVDGAAHYADFQQESIGGENWIFDYAADTLFLNNFHGESIAVANELESFTLHLTGENSLQGIDLTSVSHAFITGGGSLSMALQNGENNWGIDAGAKLTVSDVKLALSGYACGLYAEESIDVSATDIAISGSRYGLYTGDLNISADSRLEIAAADTALKLSGTCMLAGSVVEPAQYSELLIENGALVSADAFRGIMIGSEKIRADELQQDHAGAGWEWFAADQMLMLGAYQGGAITANVDFVHLHAAESIQGLDISVPNLTMSADEGVWLANAEIQADHLNLLSGSYEQRNFIPLALESLSISGGRLTVEAGIAAADVKLSGGALETGVLTAETLEICGGSLNVTDSMLYAEEAGEKVYYGLVAQSCTFSSGSLITAEPAFFGNYTQTGGSARFAENAGDAVTVHTIAVGASEAFNATGGRLEVHNGYGIALFATDLKLGGKLNADIYGEGGLFFAETASIAGKSVEPGQHTTLVMKNGKAETLGLEKYYGMVINGKGFGKHMVKTASLSGNGWSWNHTTKTLTLNGHIGFSPELYFDVGAVNLHFLGGSSVVYDHLEVISLGALTITGNGNLEMAKVQCDESITVNGCANLRATRFITNKNLTLKNVRGERIQYEVMGNVNITGSEVEILPISVVNKNLTIKDSNVIFSDSEDGYCGFVFGKTQISNSIVRMETRLYSKKGTSISSNAAVFRLEYGLDVNPLYTLVQNATLSQDWTLLAASREYYVPKNRKLTIKKGSTLYLLNDPKGIDNSELSGTVNGNVVTLGPANQVHLSGSSELPIGASTSLTAWTMPEKTAKGLRWMSSDLSLCEVDVNGVVTATKDPARIGEKVIITAVYEGNDQIFATHEITLIPAAGEIAARDASGLYAKSIELCLDPAGNTARLSARVYPSDARQEVAWKSSNAKIAAVDANGVVTAKKAGSANIYAVAADGSEVQSQAIQVTVRKAPSSIKFTTGNPVLGFDPENGTGSSAQLKVKLSSGSASSVTYSSADEGIAAVDENGVVTAKGVGKVKITAKTYNGKKATCTVNVKAAPDSVTITPEALTIGVGDTYTFKGAIPKNSYGTWFFSTDNACGAIDAGTGVFTALKPGVVQVSAVTFNGRSASAVVEVLPAPDEIELNVSAPVLGVGEKLQLEPVAKTADGFAAAARYSYASKDKKIAAVSASGKITAKKAGTTEITVTAHNGAAVQCTVTVMKAPGKVSISPTKLTLAYDAETQMGAGSRVQVKLPNKTSSALIYSSSKPAVATVSQDGFITAAGVGKTKITVKTFNGKKASCTVTVVAAPRQLSFEQQVYTVPVGESVYIGINNAAGIPMPDYAEIGSRNPEILALQDAGMQENGAAFTAVSVGETQVYANAFNGAEGVTAVRVLPEPDALYVGETTLTLKKGKKHTLQPEVSRADGQETAARYSFATSNKKVATVSETGQISAKAKGSATITVSTHNGLMQKIELKVN